MFCGNCGAKIESNSKICSNCGTYVVVTNSNNNLNFNEGVNSNLSAGIDNLQFSNAKFMTNNNEQNIYLTNNIEVNNSEEQLEINNSVNMNQTRNINGFNNCQKSFQEQTDTKNAYYVPNPNFNFEYNNNYQKPININTGGVRKAIKEKAMGCRKTEIVLGTLLSCIIIYVLCFGCVFFLVFLGLISVSGITEGVFQSAVFRIILVILIYALLITIPLLFLFSINWACLNILRGNSVTIGEFLTVPFKKFKRSGEYILICILYAIFTGIITFATSFIPGINSIILAVLSVYITPALHVLLLLYADENQRQMNLFDAISSSFALVKGHRIQFYAMSFSFIGWVLLGVISFGIGYLWIIPYMCLATTGMYLTWIGEDDYSNTTKTGLSDGAVVGIGIGGTALAFVLMFLSLFSMIIASKF